jgi:hypothetical protein
MKKAIVFFVLLLYTSNLIAQDTDLAHVNADTTSYEKIGIFKPIGFFKPAPKLSKARIGLVSGSIIGIYGAANVWWSKAWYSQYDRTKFHLFNDAKEWQQMDKGGHVFNAYYLSKWGYNMYHWAGVSERHAPWIGALYGNMWQMSIEMQDAFSAKWGFSLSDVAANLSGSLLFLAQQYTWHDQRIKLKISAWPEKYPSDVKQRANELYGTSYAELLLKDYNAITYWVSVSPGAFIHNPKSKFPKWIDVSLGYGGSGMYGGFDNKWCANKDLEVGDCPAMDIIDRSDIDRNRQFYISLDVDFTKIPTKSHALKTFFEVINIFKIPFPAVEFNTKENVRWRWLMF